MDSTSKRLFVSLSIILPGLHGTMKHSVHILKYFVTLVRVLGYALDLARNSPVVTPETRLKTVWVHSHLV
ncbi:hypothetical protein NZK35_34265, partial [Stieleria sp. ICT_E10.1]|nr:hypothetical protein [Stieleria sedimenti]